jgi:NAD-dependent dihydropyrimidine dehydrogenase PreA subunit
MRIDSEKCIGCGTCIPYCNVGAIELRNEVAQIKSDVCVECWVCYRSEVCPNDCFERTSLESFNDVFKHVLSDPTETIQGTGVAGRGTEEVKTNDVTGRFTRDVYGICIDMGRPGVGVRMRDVEKVAMALAKAGLKLASPRENPLGAVMTDLATGKLQQGILDVHLLSVIIEGTCKRENLASILDAVRVVENDIDTVFSLGIISMLDDDKDQYLMEVLEAHGLGIPIRAKVNVGLGRPLFKS